MEGFQFVDVILLAMVAGFLILRLRSSLGRRTGHEQGQDGFDQSDNVVNLPARNSLDPDAPAALDVDPAYIGTPFEEGLAQITLSDPNFSVEDFLFGAGRAFEMIVIAYANHDTDTLRPLLSDDVYSNFAAAVQDREDRDEVLQTELVVIKPSKLEEVSVQNRTATIAVRFESDQVNVIKDAEGAIVDGDPKQVENVTDIWTFERNLANADLNWQLVATRSVD
ncbi:MAG: Tim44/TimA family putative adaptor protein [Rhodospirillaceae bacterium]|jgi:predicted lipid-binding transport protein (Tim44 family)|nr:Tim44/TimA family putative adaptor protein [Rhodospirillaceae bacterium]